MEALDPNEDKLALLEEMERDLLMQGRKRLRKNKDQIKVLEAKYL